MFLLLAVPVGIIAGLCRGGRISGLGHFHLRRWQYAFVGLLIQVPIFSSALADNPLLVRYGIGLYVLSFVLLFVTLFSNWQWFGVPVLTMGAVLNFVAIAANGGHMPVSGNQMQSTLGAAQVEAVQAGQTLTNVAVATQHTRLAFLGDLIPMPSWLPFANVFSVGDAIIAFGAILIIQATMCVPKGAAAPLPPTELAAVRRDG